MSFETNPRFLRDLLAEARAGRLQLPDFQRSYVWGDEDVRMLIASILRGFPVGALLTLRSGGPVSFRPRLLEGVEAARQAAGEGPAQPAEELLLDGQQRITSLFGAMASPLSMTVRKPKSERKTLQRFYYLDIARALDAGEELEDAILGLPEARIRRDEARTIDLSTREREFEAGCFPLNLAFSDAAFDWVDDFRDHWRADPQRSEAAKVFRKRILEPLRAYQMPVITLGQQTSREAVCLVFEKVNVGGKKLDAFELVTAIFAGAPEPLNLRDDWAARFARIRGGGAGQGMAMPVFDNLRGFDFLQAVSLAATHARRRTAEAAGNPDLPQISARREALLALDLADFRAHAPTVEEGFREAGKFLAAQKVLWAADLPYPAQAVALAAIFAIAAKAAQTAAGKERLSRWFWRTALAEDYGTSPESKLARDAEEVSRWLQGGEEPERMRLLTFNPDRLESLRMRVSAAYRAFAALLLREGCRDFITGQAADITTFAGDPMDVHHIFPRQWCEARGIQPEAYDSILNKTPLTAASNRAIGGHAPSAYLHGIEDAQGLTLAEMDSILRSHLIEPAFLRADDFKGFLADRKRRLAELAARAMGAALAAPAAPVEPEGEGEAMEEAA
ncbi:MAG: GmrSD restriction endonuclease domain-containing protein [Pseudomonadota bacterium]